MFENELHLKAVILKEVGWGSSEQDWVENTVKEQT